ncbi:hypothetical protein, partial [Escherichia coli]
MGSCAAPSAKGDDKFITTDYLQQCRLHRQLVIVFQQPLVSGFHGKRRLSTVWQILIFLRG